MYCIILQVEQEETIEQADDIEEPIVEQEEEPYSDQANTVTETQETYPEDVPQPDEADEQPLEEEYTQDVPLDEVIINNSIRHCKSIQNIPDIIYS